MGSNMAIATELTIQSAKDKVLKGELELDLSGWLKRKDTGAGLGYKMIRLYRKKPSEGSLRFYYELGNYPNGFYVFRLIREFDELGIYQYQTRFEGDAEFSACKSPILQIECYVPTPEAIDTSISIKADPTQVILPEKITISGKLVRKDTGAGIPYKNIEIYWKRPSKEFSLLTLRGTESDGRYRAYPTLIEEGTYRFYSKFLGDETFDSCESSIVEAKGVGEKDSKLMIELAIVPKYVGDRADINGTLTCDGELLGDRKYEMCQRKNGGSWSCVEDRTLSDGSIIWLSPALEKGSYEWQGKFEGYTKIYDSESVKGCVSNIVRASVQEEEPPTPDDEEPPVDITYALRCNYWNWGNASKDAIETGVRNIVVPLIATEFALLGYDYAYAERDFHDQGYFEIYFKPRGTPAIPLVTLIPLLKWVFITICVAIIGITISYVAWVHLETKKIEAEEKKSKRQLLEEGLISEETYKTLIEAQKEEDDMWGKLMEWLPMLLLFLIIASIAGALRRD